MMTVGNEHTTDNTTRLQVVECEPAGKFSVPLRSQSDWLRSNVTAPLVGVDHDKNIIRGYVVAQLGPFKTPGRGEFDEKSLKQIVGLMNRAPGGLKSRLSHPTLSDDGLAKFLGRARDGRLDGDRVRADLHLDPTSFETPGGDLGGYVMRRAESDPDSFSSSLVLKSDKLYRVDKRGRRERDDNGDELPPIWRPTELHASDVVDEGDAVDSFLSTDALDALPDAAVRQGAEILNRQFPNLQRDELRARAVAWLERYLDWRFGAGGSGPHPDTLRRRRRLRKMRG